MGRYTVPINIRFTGTTAAGSTVWALTASAGAAIFIRRIVLFCSFDGTAAASTARHEIRRHSAAVPSGGAAITPIPKDEDDGASTVADVRQDTAGGALTVTSVVFQDPMLTASCPRGTTGSVSVLNLDFAAAPIKIDPSDGLCIQNSIVAVVGDAIAGFIEWEEE